MKPRALKSEVLIKLVIATVAIVAIVGFAGSRLVPSAPLATVLLYSAAGLAVAFAVIIAGLVVVLTWTQFILRKGGTDPQLFWFAAEPPGLVELRQQAKSRMDP